MARLKALVWKIPGARPVLKRLYVPLRRAVFRWRCYGHDIRNDRRYSYWFPPAPGYGKLSHELIFQYHKLEKGLCLPWGARRFFGSNACNAVLDLLARWKKAGHCTQTPVYQAALGVMTAYDRRLDEVSADHPEAGKLRTSLAPYLRDSGAVVAGYATPIPLARPPDSGSETLRALALARRSVRNFADRPVRREDVIQAVAVAQLSPSACNRQPWKLHLFEGQDKMRGLLALQNGNAGFGHTIPLLAAITVDMESGFDASERIGPVLDGGLFLMSFLLALQAHGLSSCCLNWAVSPATDRKGHEAGGIPANERILTLLAIGYAAEDCIVPLSARRPLDNVVHWH